MRISGGAARGVTLQVPKGDLTRPATDGMRQAVFSSLGARLPGARFVDLFAGSGAYGLEAFSRGAESGVFVEKNPKATECIRKNMTAVAKSAGRAESVMSLLAADALAWAPPQGEAPDLVFIDPPYELIATVAPMLFERMAGWWPEAADPVVIFEMPGELELKPPGWVCVKRLGKGAHQPTVGFFRRAPLSPAG
jgi:16S rRNA (guanine966-N2)-methyltransferase